MADDYLAPVQEAVANALGVDEDEAAPDATLMEDLGAESIDLLDILFRVERATGVKIQASDLGDEIQGGISDEEFGAGETVSRKGLEHLTTVMPQMDPDEWRASSRRRTSSTTSRSRTWPTWSPGGQPRRNRPSPHAVSPGRPGPGMGAGQIRARAQGVLARRGILGRRRRRSRDAAAARPRVLLPGRHVAGDALDRHPQARGAALDRLGRVPRGRPPGRRDRARGPGGIDE